MSDSPINSTDSTPLSAWIALVAICIIWGTTYLAIKIGVEFIPGLFLSGVRNAIAGFVLLIIARLKSKEKSDTKTLLFLIGIGFLNLAMGNGFISWAEEYVSSGLAAIISALTPLWMMIFSIIILKDAKLNLMTIIGLFLGFLGVVGIFTDSLAELFQPEYLLGIILILISNVAWAFGSVMLVKRSPKRNVFYISGVQMFSAGIILTIISVLFETIPPLGSVPQKAWFALIYLIVFGSILTYMAYMHSLKYIKPTRVSIHAYINPLVALWLGWLILDEKLNIYIVISALVTLLGVWMVNRGYAKSKAKTIGIDIVK